MKTVATLTCSPKTGPDEVRVLWDKLVQKEEGCAPGNGVMSSITTRARSGSGVRWRK